MVIVSPLGLPVTAHVVCVSLCVSVQAVEHDTFTQCWVYVGPPSTTLTQHYPSIGLLCRVCVSLYVGQRHRQRDNINPALVQSIVPVV